MKNTIFAAALIILLCFLAVNCKKSKNDTSDIDLNALIVGRWHLDSTAFDANGNGQIDPNEITAYTGGIKTETYKNGEMFDTGTYGTTSIYQHYSYTFIPSNIIPSNTFTSGIDNTFMKLTSKDTGAHYGNTYSYNIVKATAQFVTFRNSATGSEYIYQKY